MSRSIKRHCSAGSQPDSLLSAEEIETTEIVGGRFELGIFGGRQGQIELANPQCHCLVEKGTQGACWVRYLCAVCVILEQIGIPRSSWLGIAGPV